MNPTFYIDIPTPETVLSDDGKWMNLKVTKSKEEAVAWIRENIGYCDKDGKISLITEG